MVMNSMCTAVPTPPVPMAVVMRTTASAQEAQVAEGSSFAKRILPAAVFVLSLTGTGTGIHAALPDLLDNPATSNLRIIADNVFQLPESADVVSPAPELVSSIQSYLGLNVSQLAEIVGVSRPTIYSWKKGKEEPNEANVARLMHLKNLIEEVSPDYAPLLGKFLKRALPSGINMAEVLSDPSSDKASFNQAYEMLIPVLENAMRRKESSRQLASGDLRSSLESRDYPGA
ncbi:MAG: helix-turn-helix domain-containing protein [Motiliproteus sp.]